MLSAAGTRNFSMSLRTTNLQSGISCLRAIDADCGTLGVWLDEVA